MATPFAGVSSSRGGGIAWLRLPAVLLIAWWTLGLLGHGGQAWCFIDWVNLPFHEAGHLVFQPFGETLHILGGTLGQLLVPLGLGAYFLFRRPNPFAAALCSWWFGENFVNIAAYMADARDMKLPLVGGGEQDWTSLFYQFGLLGEESVRHVSAATRLLGVLLMLAGIAWSAYFVLPAGRREAIREWIGARLPALQPFLSIEGPSA